MSESPATPCPACGTPASGNFCESCGARLGAAFCPACGGKLAPGAQFCGQCGQSVGGAAGPVATPRESMTPWIVAALLVFVTIAGVVYAAGARNRAASPDMANAGNETAAAATSGSAMPTGPAPDISQMTPREQFTRLNDRIMNAAQTGDTSTVIQFWPMAAGAYQNLPDSDRDADVRYRMAELHLLIGQFPQTLALADTILQKSPDNLLAYYLRGIVADFQGDSTAAREARKQFNQHYDAEMAKDRPEYTRNAPLLQGFHTGS